MKKHYVIGIDIGGTFTRIGITDGEFHIINLKKFLTNNLANSFADTIVSYYNNNVIEHDIKGIFIGFPGVIDQKNNEVLSVPNQHKLEGKKHLLSLQKELPIPVRIFKDTNFLLAHDIHKHKLLNIKSVLGFYVGTGFGMSMKIDGLLYTGDRGNAGEIGHIQIPNETDICGCGKIGCLETIASGVKLIKIYEEHFENTTFSSIFTHHKDNVHIIEFVKNIALGITIGINLFDIRTIIIGGGVINMTDFPKQLLEDFIKKHVRSEQVENTITIYYSESTSKDGVIGAGILGYEYLRGEL